MGSVACPACVSRMAAAATGTADLSSVHPLLVGAKWFEIL